MSFNTNLHDDCLSIINTITHGLTEELIQAELATTLLGKIKTLFDCYDKERRLLSGINQKILTEKVLVDHDNDSLATQILKLQIELLAAENIKLTKTNQSLTTEINQLTDHCITSGAL
ncbi:hypothetical protein A6E01_19760 (plasmid) [Vibrio breoganii]|uniref:Uncharacterized protein n=1 Tax=Vibrio breoganii TaxID=553239 RepID=A0AAN1CU73_9VIBR|nr:hypothetical protein [Vibrio breoganii]ANO35451.1 hypothetical protein A6E01_19760 [Vibrio breoganii]PML13946.1 hypothetical protein BCT84_12360 [Vibrio breoganii]